MKPARLYPIVSTFSLACVLALPATPNAHAADNILHDMAIEFLVDELVPTLLALATAALREPMTWGVIVVATLPALWRRHRSSTRAQRP
jgi:hypothetical protein